MKSSPAKKRKRIVPLYWWDFSGNGEDEITIETNDPRIIGGVVAKIHGSVTDAEKMIAALNEGRLK